MGTPPPPGLYVSVNALGTFSLQWSRQNTHRLLKSRLWHSNPPPLHTVGLFHISSIDLRESIQLYYLNLQLQFLFEEISEHICLG